MVSKYEEIAKNKKITGKDKMSPEAIQFEIDEIKAKMLKIL